jgi:hypothetical protein
MQEPTTVYTSWQVCWNKSSPLSDTHDPHGRLATSRQFCKPSLPPLPHSTLLPLGQTNSSPNTCAYVSKCRLRSAASKYTKSYGSMHIRLNSSFRLGYYQPIRTKTKFQNFRFNSLRPSAGYDVTGHKGLTTNTLVQVKYAILETVEHSLKLIYQTRRRLAYNDRLAMQHVMVGQSYSMQRWIGHIARMVKPNFHAPYTYDGLKM